MKKIKTLFEREFENHKVINISSIPNKDCEWVLEGEGIATIKYDGTCTLIQDGRLYRRYDAKKGKKPPVGAIPCCEPDLITGHHPHWLEVNLNNPKPDEKIFIEAIQNTFNGDLRNAKNGTYELCGPKINSNRENLDNHIFIKHGEAVVEVDRTFDGIQKFLEENYIEGLVFHRQNESNDMCKIKRKDFGYKWGA